jgi:hypothetical protein
MSKRLTVRQVERVVTFGLATALGACAPQESVRVNEPSPPPPATVDPAPAAPPPPAPTSTLTPIDPRPEGPAVQPAAAPAMLLHLAANQTYCIEAAQDRSAKRTPVRLFICHGQENQRWTLTPGPNGSTTIAGMGGLCVDVHGVHPADGSNAQLKPCGGGPSQQFTNDSGRLKDVATGKCLTVTKAARGAPIIVEPCDPGNAGQAWSIADR